MKFLIFLLFASQFSWATELRRETTMPLGECETQNYSPDLVKATAYVNLIKDRIIAANPDVFRGDLAAIGAGVQNSESPRAWAAKRSCVVEAGLILRVQNDAQLAFAIAHEMAHLTMRHNTDGVPVSSLQAQQRQVQELEAQVQALQKGTPAYIANFQSVSTRLEAAKAIVISALVAAHGADFANNWDEAEADLVGAHLMLRAGFRGNEVGWRNEQLAISQEAGLDNHSPAPQISAQARITAALSACGASSIARMTEPARGNGPYPNACWSIWKLTKDEPSGDSAYRTLLNAEGLVNLPGTNLSDVKAEIRANLNSGPILKEEPAPAPAAPASSDDDEE